MICFVCKKNISNFLALVAHYKIIHLLKSSSTFECTEYRCNQSFPNLKNFKRHVSIKHARKTTAVPIFNNVNDNNGSNNINTTHIIDSSQHVNQINYAPINTYNTSDNNPILPTPINDIFNLNNAINSFQTSAVKFTLSLLNKNNFSRKDVFEIQREIEKNLIKPIENLITSYEDCQSI